MTLTLTGFTGDAIAPIGIVTFPVTFGDEPRTKTLMVPFMVVELPLAYNVIIDQPTLSKLRVIVSMYHRSIKFPTNAGAREARSDQHESSQCYLEATIIPKKVKKEAPVPDPREPGTRFSAQANRADIGGALDKDSPERTIRVGSTLPEDRRIQLVNFLERNADVFAWSPSDMSGVRPEIAQHRLSTIPMLGNLSGCITCAAKSKTKIGFPRRSNHRAKYWGHEKYAKTDKTVMCDRLILPREIIYPYIPDLDGEDEGGQASSSLAVSTRWISAAKLLQSYLATITKGGRRIGGGG
ncbi:hypothetical protein B296_00055132 [Ensete ventricosum]|uniref:Uncharacterized protein n=1 Tax=Ensete ventricosum TaxID=4639 RepID=A0A426X9F1_ENSVE|nr:hypothetical protein B296_00055132 [Ensete ventricosum]